MKKTIAILLVLVIAGVGLFAAEYEGTSDLYLKTIIAPINQMTVTATSTPFEWGAENFTSAFGTVDDAYNALTDDANFGKYGEIAHLQARSNSRTGFGITMTALALKSSNEYINYNVKVGTIEILTTDDTPVTSSNLEIPVYVNGVVTSINTPISVELKKSLANSAEGTYVGQIIFSYTAN